MRRDVGQTDAIVSHSHVRWRLTLGDSAAATRSGAQWGDVARADLKGGREWTLRSSPTARTCSSPPYPRWHWDSSPGAGPDGSSPSTGGARVRRRFRTDMRTSRDLDCSVVTRVMTPAARRELRHEGGWVRCWVWTLDGCTHCGVQ